MPLRILLDTNVLISAALDDFMASITYEAFATPETICPQDFPALRDATDVPILASAILANVDILITGDKDFSPVNRDRPLIFTPRQYYNLIPH